MLTLLAEVGTLTAMTGTPRERARAQTMDDITRIGREHLVAHGAAALSLRAVARDLGVVSSAVYRYVRSRDELLTLLVIDGYTELGDEVDAAVGAAPPDDFRAQFRAIGIAVRDWALREPARYALLFGTPVQGYDAPAEQTTGPGTRVIVALISLFQRAYDAGALVVTDAVPIPDAMASDFAAIRAEYAVTIPDGTLARGVFVWSSLFGAVNFDVFDQYGAGTFTDRSQIYNHNLDVMAETLGLQ